MGKLQELVAGIDDDLRMQSGEEGPREPRPGLQVRKLEGRGTRFVVERALQGLGGEATARQIVEWVSKHPEMLEELKDVRLNQKKSIRKAKGGEAKETDQPVWVHTVTSMI